ncbi:alpha-2-macroglobulin family protein [Polaribacter sp.]|uniref:alpha-2-macroglobulin family protein n=1 Tax=Polaribacter sp. TaxID=1920175 RepID=UPI0040484B08
MKTKHFLVLLSAFLVTFSCKKDNIQPNNIFKFKEYIKFTTSGVVSVAEKITVNLAKDVEGWQPNQEISAEIIAVKPFVNGKIKVLNNHAFEFIPDENLAPNTAYTVMVKLGELYKNTPKEFETYTFQFKTITPSFIIKIGTIQSYSRDYQYIEGMLQSADIIDLEQAKMLIQASQKGKSKKIVWNESYQKERFFEFKIDSVQRFETQSVVSVSWDGKPIDCNLKGENDITIPGKDSFKVLSIKPVDATEQYISINFSDPLQKQQNFDGLVTIENEKNPRFIINGNELKVFSEVKFSGNIKVSVFEGVKSADDFTIKKYFSETITFEQQKPEIRAISSGVILPNSSNLVYNFEAINLKAVDVKIIKIYEKNVLQFLQENNLNSTDEYQLKRVGRRVAKKTITLVADPKNYTQNWRAYSIDISKMVATEPGAIYRIEISFGQHQSLYKCDENTISKEITEEDNSDKEENEELYWDNQLYDYRDYDYDWSERNNPCNKAYYKSGERFIAQNLLASNLGITAKKGTNNEYFFAITNIVTSKPEGNAKVQLFNYQQQEIATKNTTLDGIATITSNKSAAFAVVTKGKNKGYIKLEDGNTLSVSNFDVSGTQTQKGIKGYLYGERGVWRPGDAMYLTFLLNDIENPLPKNHPVKLEITDPQGKLIYKKVTSDNVNNFYSFKVQTAAEAKTGNYEAMVSVGGAKFYKSLKVETVKPNRLKIKVDFEDEILTNQKPINGTVDVKWLHGTPAKNLKTTITAKISAANFSFKKYQIYLFSDPSRSFETEEITFFDGKLNENGISKFNKDIKIGENAPGMLRVQFLVRAFENGGDFSIDAFTKNYAPYTSFVGLKTPNQDKNTALNTDENQQFSIVSVNENGVPIQNTDVEVAVYQIAWRWWWSASNDNLSKYTASSYHKPYKTFNIKTNAKGEGTFKLNIPEAERGRFLVRVIDKKSGHATGKVVYFYKNWWENATSGDKEAAKMLIFSSDKEKYTVGETAKITFPSGSSGNALVSIENGTKILETKWVAVQKGMTTVEIPITKNMAPNVYASISLLQPHQISENDLPIRLFGTIPLFVEDASTKLEPQISMPNELQPEKEFSLTVSEKNNKAMTYSVAIVEDGLLDLTRFKTPNAFENFFAREALGIKTWDIFDDVIGAYSGSVDQVFAIGGDGNLEKGKNPKVNRFEPVVKYLGPFQLEKGAKKSHKITLPNYIGSVRVMVVAGNVKQEAYGSAEKTVPVKKPLMILATLPRKLSPKEKVRLPISIFTMDDKIKNVTVKVNTSKGLKIIGNNSQTISFSKSDEKMCYVDLDVLNFTGIQTVEILGTANGQNSKYKVNLEVVNPNPIASKLIEKTLQPNSEQIIDFETFGVQGSNAAMLELSTIPAINFTSRLAYLIQYPHGCLEQTTSSVFPQLYMPSIFDISSAKKQEIQENITQGIRKIGNFQKPNGGLSYWLGEDEISDWGTSYAGHFMLEAEKKGFVLPLTFKTNFIAYQKQVARNWRPSYNTYLGDLEQAYRLYTLALANNPDLSTMNRLREFTELSNDAKWRLAAAYVLVGQKEASDAILKNAKFDFSESDYYNFGSNTRNAAMALETMLLTNNKNTKELATSIAKDLSSNQWMSTQTTAFSLLAIGKMVEKNGGKALKITITNGTKSEKIDTKSSLIQRNLVVKNGKNTIRIKNNENNLVYVRILNYGKPALGNEISETRGLSVSVKYKDLKGAPITVNQLKQGQDFVATITVSNPKNTTVNDIAITQIFPSGWEIVNTRFTDFGTNIKSEARYTDVKDDRVHFYLDLKKQAAKPESKTFTVLLNAAYLGNYYLPGIQVEAMYDNDYFVKTKGSWIKVVE